MRCVACGRPLNFATFTVATREGPASWGPTCARRAGLIEAKSRRHRAQKVVMADRSSIWDPHPRKLDPNQRDLWEDACVAAP